MPSPGGTTRGRPIQQDIGVSVLLSGGFRSRLPEERLGTATDREPQRQNSEELSENLGLT